MNMKRLSLPSRAQWAQHLSIPFPFKNLLTAHPDNFSHVLRSIADAPFKPDLALIRHEPIARQQLPVEVELIALPRIQGSDWTILDTLKQKAFHSRISLHGIVYPTEILVWNRQSSAEPIHAFDLSDQTTTGKGLIMQMHLQEHINTLHTSLQKKPLEAGHLALIPRDGGYQVVYLIRLTLENKAHETMTKRSTKAEAPTEEELDDWDFDDKTPTQHLFTDAGEED